MLMTIFALIVSAAIDSVTLSIGDQTDLHLRVTCDAKDEVSFPVLEEELIPGIEITDRTIIDTAILKDGRVQYDQYITLQSFCDSLFEIDPLEFKANGQTYWSDPLTLNVVQPFEMDTTIQINDIKEPYKAPIWWWGILRWVLLALGILLLLALIGLGVFYWVKYLAAKEAGKKFVIKEKPVPLRPADVVALEKLDAIRQSKVWQQGKVKEYHTELTDVVREYIERRFGVNSVEQTTDETLRAMRPLLQERKDLYEQLRKMLTLADLIKFAKWTASPDEHEISLRDAYTLVKETTVQPEPEETEKKTKK
jgi:hypothetical protein